MLAHLVRFFIIFILRMPSTLLASPSGSASSLRTRVFAEQMCLAHTSSHDMNASFRVAWRATARHTSPRAPEVTTPVPSRKHQATTTIRLQRVGCLVLCQVRHCDADACACGLCTDPGPPCRSKCQKPLNKCAAKIGGGGTKVSRLFALSNMPSRC